MTLKTYLGSIEDKISDYVCIPVVIVITMNLFHIFILSRKSMTPSSMNSLLIGIAIVEILFPISYLKIGVAEFLRRRATLECLTYESYQEVHIDWFLDIENDCFRRCSCWLGLFLAVIRTVSVRKALDRKYDFLSKSKFGWKVIVITIVSSTILSVSYFFRFEIRKVDEVFCDESHPLVPLYSITEISQYSTIGSYARQIHLFLSGVFGKILPCFMFPSVAILLVIELRKASKLQGDIAIASEKTSKIVIYMTVIFVIIEFPIGVCKLIRVLLPDELDLVEISRSVERLINILYICLTATHSLICFAMSSQYRSTVKEVFGMSPGGSKVVSVIEVRAIS